MAKARRGAKRGESAAGNTIAFQGEPGANSDMACRAAFPYMNTLPCPTFETAMAAVQAERAELAIIPVENSIAGRVADLHSLLPHTKLKIVAEHFQRVEHCLVALPGATLKTVRTVKSHVQALAQCRNFLKKHRFVPLVHADTAGAAREIAEDGDASVAPSPPRSPRASTTSRFWRATSRMPTTTPPACWCSRATKPSRTGAPCRA